MTVNLHHGTRIRIYVSRKGHDLPAIQEYFSLIGTNKKQEQAVWGKAIARHDELQQKWRITDNAAPWSTKRVNQTGQKNRQVIPVRNIYMTCEGHTKGATPDWGRTGNYYFFDTYPPRFAVQVWSGKHKRVKISKCFNFRSNRQFKSALIEAIEFLIEHKPQFECYRAEMLASIPNFSGKIEQTLCSKYEAYYGEKPW